MVRQGIAAVLAMQYEITDRAAIEFSRTFYEALAYGLPIDASVSDARVSVNIEVNNSFEWGTPVLYMRSLDGVLFEMASLPVTPPKPIIAENIDQPEKDIESEFLESIRRSMLLANSSQELKHAFYDIEGCQKVSSFNGRQDA